MTIAGSFFVLLALGLAAYKAIKNKDVCIAAIIFFLVFGMSLLNASPGFRFKSFVEDINLKQVSIVGSDVFERKIQVTYKEGSLISVEAVPNTIVKVRTSAK